MLTIPGQKQLELDRCGHVPPLLFSTLPVPGGFHSWLNYDGGSSPLPSSSKYLHRHAGAEKHFDKGGDAVLLHWPTALVVAIAQNLTTGEAKVNMFVSTLV